MKYATEPIHFDFYLVINYILLLNWTNFATNKYFFLLVISFIVVVVVVVVVIYHISSLNTKIFQDFLYARDYCVTTEFASLMSITCYPQFILPIILCINSINIKTIKLLNFICTICNARYFLFVSFFFVYQENTYQMTRM